jgi:hypothetical protein
LVVASSMTKLFLEKRSKWSKHYQKLNPNLGKFSKVLTKKCS